MKKTLFSTTILASLALASAANAGGEPYSSPKKAASNSKAAVATKSNPVQHSADSLAAAFVNGKAYIDARYRYERVDQDGFSSEANANTLRTNLGFKTAKWHAISGHVEMQNVAVVGDEQYNSTVNGKTAFPTVADPEGTEVNQAYLTYDGIRDTSISAGRKKINLGNQRFVGSVGWRQNDQTFDSALVSNNSIKDLNLLYGFLWNANRVFGNDSAAGDWDSQSHIINATYSGLQNHGLGSLTGFAYLLDINNSLANSSATYGARWNGGVDLGDSGVKFLYDASYAQQSDHADNPNDYDANYYHVEPGLSWKGLTLKGGWESLGADDGTSAGRVFRTPHATGHKFNGWADQFLTTPAGGLEDLYAVASYKVDCPFDSIMDGTKLTVAYHDFQAETSTAGVDDDIGSEWNASITQTFYDHYTVGVKYANYEDEGGANTTTTADVEKFWVTLGVKFQQR